MQATESPRCKANRLAAEADAIRLQLAKQAHEEKLQKDIAETEKYLATIPRAEKLFVIDYVCQQLRMEKNINILFDPDGDFNQDFFDLTAAGHAAYAERAEEEKKAISKVVDGVRSMET